MGDTDGWRRAALDYRSKFEEDFVFSVPGALEGAPPLRIAQAPSATAAEKRVGCLRPAAPSDRRGAGSSSRDAGPASSSSPAVSDDAEDPIPATGFTVWDAGVLLGAYVSQPEVWRRLTTAADVPPRKLEDDDAMASTRSTLRGLSLTGSNEPVRPSDECLTVLELGAGTGVAGLALASTGLPSAVALTDLPGVCAFLRHNAARNKAAPPPRDEFGKNRKRVFPERTSAGRSVGRSNLKRTDTRVAAIPTDVAVAVAPLRWGVETDIANLRAAFRNPRVVLGADLAYTENVAVVEKLAATVRACVPRGGVAVFASCRDHRPESVDLLEALLLEGGAFEARRVRGDELAPGFGRRGGPRDEDEREGEREGSQTPAREFDESFRVVEFRRVAGDAMSDAEAEAIRARDARGDVR
jgi:predicted nicotinamide N-methyase